MSNDISSLIPYLYSINSNNQIFQDPLLSSDDDSDNTDDSISSLGLDSIQLSPEALSTLNSLQTSNTNNILNSTLDSLVENNTITQEQENSIKNAISSLNTASSTYSNTNSQSPLDKLVSSGIITQDQEDSIKSALLSSRNGEIQKQAKLISENPLLSNNPELYLNSDLYQQNNDSNSSILNEL
ncbi:hypothetical protein ACFHWD_15910 [Clostridium sp. MT-14]|mgnify:FL=1|jgi:competence protein ComGC|uniref:Uncharacterized protein n=1 Tax=Clostridium aromativorans TaxID=2836848 RepID=A0ABS8N7C3_9CLOT|nr:MULTISPECIES: hypothetical protein [Clostridium]KAA8673291.1 hypothetical protein F3O63_09295 [Clostridium sp. HV4-5-A1G]MCC9294980.1 hypothetical protein [Clostridium aromativorans]CAB1262716.1 conserved hypothetical protein [Clostridiaceae bacterium BL-3]